MSCQQCSGIRQQFDARQGQKQLKRFRRSGPDRTTRMLIDLLRGAIQEGGTGGLTLLDVGAGVGAIHHVLLNGLVSRATHVDASPSQLAAAREETERRGHAGVVEFLEGDFTAMADRVPAADIVTLDRVICCFDDMEPLVRHAGGKAGRFFGAVYPRNVTWARIGIAVINGVQRLKRSPFRVFMHDPREIDALLRATGLRPYREQKTMTWQVVVYHR